MQKNVAGQRWRVFAFDSTTNAPKTGDAPNITAKLSLDFAAATGTNDATPDELEDGYYEFILTQAETNCDDALILPESSTGNIVVIGCPAQVSPTTGGDATAANQTTMIGLLTTVDNVVDATATAIAGLNDISTSDVDTALTTAWTTAIVESYRATGATGSPIQILYEILGHLINKDIVGTTLTVKKLDKVTTAKTYTLDNAVTPTAIEETT